MRKQINLICSILALFCFISMYVPVIAPKYPASDYVAPAGDDRYFYTGDYYLAKEYWTITHYVFANDGVVGRVVLSLDQALMLVWAMLCFRGKAERDKELPAAVFNLLVVCIEVARMLGSSWACMRAVLIVMGLVMFASVAMAANGPMPEKK